MTTRGKYEPSNTRCWIYTTYKNRPFELKWAMGKKIHALKRTSNAQRCINATYKNRSFEHFGGNFLGIFLTLLWFCRVVGIIFFSFKIYLRSKDLLFYKIFFPSTAINNFCTLSQNITSMNYLRSSAFSKIIHLHLLQLAIAIMCRENPHLIYKWVGTCYNARRYHACCSAIVRHVMYLGIIFNEWAHVVFLSFIFALA